MPHRAALTALATTLLLLTGCGGEPASDTPSSDSTSDVGAASGGGVTVAAGDIYYADGDSRSDEGEVTFTADAGEVEVTLENDGALEHNVVVEEAGDELVVSAAAGETSTGTVDLDGGTYTIYCDIAGHREAGMVATLTVE
ncbi:plastocyanin/azurin family copper-binding protein [Euzebya sp.]|uniref:plastocyanin/azurin family copper-binding protein n=1 Tax=Euzebya sp. TaxID=1971409 RepID=UPI003513D4D3